MGQQSTNEDKHTLKNCGINAQNYARDHFKVRELSDFVD